MAVILRFFAEFGSFFFWGGGELRHSDWSQTHTIYLQ